MGLQRRKNKKAMLDYNFSMGAAILKVPGCSTQNLHRTVSPVFGYFVTLPFRNRIMLITS